MALMKGDMGGAATVAGALYGICKLGLPLNVTAVTPLCENLPSGRATKPGKWNMKWVWYAWGFTHTQGISNL